MNLLKNSHMCIEDCSTKERNAQLFWFLLDSLNQKRTKNFYLTYAHRFSFYFCAFPPFISCDIAKLELNTHHINHHFDEIKKKKKTDEKSPRPIVILFCFPPFLFYFIFSFRFNFFFVSLHAIESCLFLFLFYFYSPDKNRPKYGSVNNLSVNPEISNKISQARSLFGGSAFSLNKVNDHPTTPNRASSATDLTNDQNNDKQTISNGNGRSTGKVSPKPVIKTPIKFTDELQVITQNNEPAKKSTFGHIFKNFFK